MNTAMEQALVAIAWACKGGFANPQSAHALEIIADALLGDTALSRQRLVILDVSEKLMHDGEACPSDGDRLMAAARRIASVTEQRNEDQYVWGETK